MNKGDVNSDLISVVVPCFNHGHFLQRSIESVLSQSYPLIQVVVVDDGSIDNTKEIATSYKRVKYIYQANSGLSAARNKGIAESNGSYLVFLDADDWLLPNALEINYHFLRQNANAVLVSGSYIMDFVESGEKKEIIRELKMDPYVTLLHHNYIGMIAAVLFRKNVFEEFKFDVKLSRCEDYDLYFNIARKYRIVHHQEKVAVYYIHKTNMSSNESDMLQTVLQVLDRQRNRLRSDVEREAYEKGKKIWKNYYCNEIYLKLKKGSIKPDFENQLTLLKYKPKLLLKSWFSNKKSFKF